MTGSRRPGLLVATSSLGVLGVQTPRILSAPNPSPRPEETAGGEFAELAELAGLVLDPWQRLVLDVTLAETPAGRWEAFETGLVVSRQNGKGADIEATELGGLYLLGEQILHTAHLMTTARSAFKRLLELITNTDWLRTRVKAVHRSADDFSIELRSGAKVTFATRSARTGRGESMDRVLYDEAMFLDPEEIAAQVPTMSTRPNPQLNYVATAGRAQSAQLRAVRARGLAGAPGMAYLEWSIGPAGRTVEQLDRAGVLDDERAYAQANPALGIRISLDYIRAERQAMSTIPELFARERLGIFDDPATAGRVISREAWDALADLGSATSGAAVFAIEVSPARTAAAIVVAGRRADGVLQVEVVATGPAHPVDGDDLAAAGLDWVIEWAAARRGARIAVAVNGPAGGLVARLDGVGADVVRVSDAELARASQAFYDTVVARGVAHLGDPVLDAAVAGGRKREIGDGAWVWSRTSSQVDISPLLGATLALHVLTGGGGELVYPQLDPTLHVATPPQLPESWPRWWVVRFGFLRPFVWQCWAEDPGGRLWLVREMYRTHRSPQEHAEAIRALVRDADGGWIEPRPRAVLCDQDAEDRVSFERALGRSTVAAPSSVSDGIAAVSKRLRPAEDGRPRLLFSPAALVERDGQLAAAARPTCTTDELPGYVWDAGKEVPCQDDLHPGLVCVRWVVAYRDLAARPRIRWL